MGAGVSGIVGGVSGMGGVGGGNQAHQQQKIYQIIKNQQENMQGSVTRNNHTN